MLPDNPRMRMIDIHIFPTMSIYVKLEKAKAYSKRMKRHQICLPQVLGWLSYAYPKYQGQPFFATNKYHNCLSQFKVTHEPSSNKEN